VVTARKKPMMANGSAKIVCAKSTSEKYFFIKKNYSPLERGRGVFLNMLFYSFQ
jgi:hypothetical protein